MQTLQASALMMIKQAARLAGFDRLQAAVTGHGTTRLLLELHQLRVMSLREYASLIMLFMRPAR